MSKKVAIAAACLAMSVSPTYAHHPLGGEAMTTLTHGLLSGVGHPLLGFDHLFFVIAVGVAALFTGRPIVATGFFIVGMLGGVLMNLQHVGVPFVEPAIALSLVIVGGLVMSGRGLTLAVASTIFAGLGVFHGWAFGEGITGQETAASMQVASGYLIGLSATQWLLAIAAGQVLKRAFEVKSPSDVTARLTGAAVAGVGAFMVLEAMEGAAFQMLGVS